MIWARNKLCLVTKTQLPLKTRPVSAMCVFGIIKTVFSKCENWRWQHSYKSSGFPHPMSEFCKGTGDYESLSGCGTSRSWKTGRFKRNDVCSARYFAVGESGLCKLNPALIMSMEPATSPSKGGVERGEALKGTHALMGRWKAVTGQMYRHTRKCCLERK